MKLPKGRLALRIYAVSLAQILAIAATVAVVGWLTFTPKPNSDFAQAARYVTETVARHVGDPTTLQHEIDRVRTFRGKLTLYGPGDRLIATSVTPPLPPSHTPTPHGPPGFGLPFFSHPPPPHIRIELDAVAGPGVYAMYQPHRPPPMPNFGVWTLMIALVAAAIASILLSRSFAQPLAALSEAARKFGAGDLAMRAQLQRRDEFGALSDSFDEMADRVVLLVRSQQELLANVSHELRTPLARIRVALDIATEGDAAAARESLSEISEDLAELERLVADVVQTARLDLSEGRMSKAEPPLRREPLDPRAVLDKAAARFRSHHDAHVLDLELASELPQLQGDAVMLRRVVDNLLDNACKYSEARSTVTLAARAQGGALEICVRDRGIGISKDDLPQVTTPFFRADRSRTRRTGGLGLGLSLARRIVEAHGGKLTIESELGVGTEVRVIIPSLG